LYQWAASRGSRAARAAKESAAARSAPASNRASALGVWAAARDGAPIRAIGTRREHPAGAPALGSRRGTEYAQHLLDLRAELRGVTKAARPVAGARKRFGSRFHMIGDGTVHPAARSACAVHRLAGEGIRT